MHNGSVSERKMHDITWMLNFEFSKKKTTGRNLNVLLAKTIRKAWNSEKLTVLLFLNANETSRHSNTKIQF